jgi:hypothetical protein
MLKFFPIKKYNKILCRNFFDYKDPFFLEKQLSDDEKCIKNIANIFSQNYLF